METGTYEIIQRRLQGHANGLRERMDALNIRRKAVFGGVETKLIATDRITTENNCIPRDMVALGDTFLFAYNVHIGLRKGIRLADVFARYDFRSEDHSFHESDLELLNDNQFQEDFQNLYKYYKDTVFARFVLMGPTLFMVFQVGKSVRDIKSFKWAIDGDALTYLGNRFDHEVKFPAQHEFSWKRTNRDMHRRGEHPHISILDRVFVEAVGGDLTVKVEDNTTSGQGIYSEPVDHKDQTLDDAEYAFADLGNLIVLRIRPYQEQAFRYLIFNEKMHQVTRVDSLEHSCVLLPDDQGLIFSNGYYLQTGDHKIFDNLPAGLQFQKRIISSNGEDFLFVFKSVEAGEYVLLPYNLVNQRIDAPIICNGYTIFPNGELTYFRAEAQAGRHHVIQIWQTPYGTNPLPATEHSDSWLFKVGNKDIVRGMAECEALLKLIRKDDTAYADLYVDLVKKTGDILDSYYWIANEEAMDLAAPLKDIREASASAIDEFEKVRQLRAQTQEAMALAEEKSRNLLDQIRRYKPKSIEKFVGYLADLRMLRGEIIALKERRYIEGAKVDEMEAEVVERTETLSADCVQFLLQPEALQPYQAQVDEVVNAIPGVEKVSEANAVGESMDGLGKQLELLIDIVSNLQIEDATETTRIIDHISGIFAQLNGLRAQLKQRRKDLQSVEATAEFNAQLKLLSQGVVNYLDLCDSPEKCDSYLTKLMVQVEELEGKFVDFPEFTDELTQKREEMYQAFETRKLGLLEARNKRANALVSAAERILKGIQNRLQQFQEITEMNAYFAGDLMVNKVRDIIEDLNELEDSVKAGDIQSRLKTLREDAIRQLKDRKELFVGGENVIKFGRHHFSVNVQELDLTIVPQDDNMCLHLTGTNFFAPIKDEGFLATESVWSQSLLSENAEVYRGEYLAWQLYQAWQRKEIDPLADGVLRSVEELVPEVQAFMATRYQEGYTKGVHDGDASRIFRALVEVEMNAGLLKFAPGVRAAGRVYWDLLLEEEVKALLQRKLHGAGLIRQVFPDSPGFGALIEELTEGMQQSHIWLELFPADMAADAAAYLFQSCTQQAYFDISGGAAEHYKAFQAHLKQQKMLAKYQASLAELDELVADRYLLIRSWLGAFAPDIQTDNGLLSDDWEEAACLLSLSTLDEKHVKVLTTHQSIPGMMGDHPVLADQAYAFDYHALTDKLRRFAEETVPAFLAYQHTKKELIESERASLRLEEFRPKVLSSFVRNQLIDQVYLPVFGDNLAKQIGTVGEETRTDRQGLLLLISPPGYGKTTLMEYIANRLGLIFMKINGPAIGHEVSSLDPSDAPNAAAREELHKLNLALEMGDNIMLYLDDIQHCNPEFLQKFISLTDAQRRIEGVYRGQTKTYDLRGKKVAVVMAGNPYTESGEKFRIPDMLSNRADTYNLGDIIGDRKDSFELSYLENALTANPVLSRLATKPQKDIYTLLQAAQQTENGPLEFESNISSEEASEYLTVLRKLVKVRDIILRVNQTYILSAGQADAYRTEPPFLLQGSYRNMNRLAEKIEPIMNEQELDTLIHGHYAREAQTLTTGAEANLLKFKSLNGGMSVDETTRWDSIKEIYLQQKRLSSDRLAQIADEMSAFTKGLEDIKNVLKGQGNE